MPGGCQLPAVELSLSCTRIMNSSESPVMFTTVLFSVMKATDVFGASSMGPDWLLVLNQFAWSLSCIKNLNWLSPMSAPVKSHTEMLHAWLETPEELYRLCIPLNINPCPL